MLKGVYTNNKIELENPPLIKIPPKPEPRAKKVEEAEKKEKESAERQDSA